MERATSAEEPGRQYHTQYEPLGPAASAPFVGVGGARFRGIPREPLLRKSCSTAPFPAAGALSLSRDQELPAPSEAWP